jgi:hypothetical protein
MTIRRVPYAVTEAAIYHLHATHADYSRTMTARPVAYGRMVTGGVAETAGYDSGSIRRQTCFLRLISIVEAYVDTLSAQLLRQDLPIADTLVRKMLQYIELRTSVTWEERRTAFEHFHGIRLGEQARWSELDAGIQVRNAIAHGLGTLTPRQRTKSLVTKLAQIKVGLRDGSVIITDISLRHCRDVCVDFVSGLDSCLH